MKFPGYKLAPDESGFSARFIGRSSVARRFIVGPVSHQDRRYSDAISSALSSGATGAKTRA